MLLLFSFKGYYHNFYFILVLDVIVIHNVIFFHYETEHIFIFLNPLLIVYINTIYYLMEINNIIFYAKRKLKCFNDIFG